MAPKNSDTSKTPIAQLTDEQVSAELNALRLAKERMELEVLTETVEKMRSQKEQVIAAIRRMQDEVRKTNARTKAMQDACKHKKGGSKGKATILSGNSDQRSIIIHTEPWGETYVMCQRCRKEWREPLFWLRRVDIAAFKKIVAIDRKAYTQAMEEYKLALQFDTDNSPSGNRMWEQVREDDAA